MMGRPLLGVLGAVTLALFIGLMVLEEDPWFKQKIEHHINATFGRTFSCCFSSQLKNINFLSGTLDLENLHAHPLQNNDSWTWSSKQAQISFSLRSLITAYSCDLDIALNEVSANSQIHRGKLAIAEHLHLLLCAPAIKPYLVKSFKICQGKITVDDLDHHITCKTLMRMNAHYQNTVITNILFEQGSIQQNTVEFAHDIQGALVIDNAIQGHASGVVNINKQSYRLHGNGCWGFNQGSLECHSQPEGLSCSITLPNENSFEAQMYLNLMVLHPSLATLHCQLSTSGCLDKIMENLAGAITLTHHDQELVQGTWQWNNQDGVGSLQLHNQKTILLPYLWVIPEQLLQLAAQITPYARDKASCSFSAQVNHTNKDLSHIIDGTCTTSAEQCVIESRVDNHQNLSCVLGLQPLYVKSLAFTQEQPNLVITSDKPGNFTGTIDFSLVGQVLQQLGYTCSDDSIIAIDGQRNPEGYTIQVGLNNAHVRIPGTYNLIQSITTQAHINARTCTFHDTSIKLHRGLLSSPLIISSFREPHYLHLPLNIHNCFINVGKDIFALVSGALLIQYAPLQGPTVIGHLIIDKSHIRSNVLSWEFQHALLQSTVSPFIADTSSKLDITITTRAPIQIKTPFLDGSARLKLAITGTVLQPEFSGNIILEQGKFGFAYEPLFIQHGQLHFLPHQPDNPLITLEARNTIKKYAITMTVGGSVKNPTISFSAIPHLEKEQIIALLMGGTEDGSLYFMMPSSISSMLEELLFGTTTTSSKLYRTLKNIFKPLQKIHLIPSFSDQTGRGGLRGGIKIDVNERLHALLQQNFSLTEDIRIEVDYDFSDDASIRVIKDERGNVGAEIETRWKF